MKLVLKAFNQMQKTVGMRLNNKPYDITVIYITFFFKCITIECSTIIRPLAAKTPPKKEVLDCDFLKPHTCNHKIKFVRSLSVLGLPCNSNNIYYVTMQKIGINITLISNYSFFLHIDFILKLKANY